jgi:hypothetical protein
MNFASEFDFLRAYGRRLLFSLGRVFPTVAPGDPVRTPSSRYKPEQLKSPKAKLLLSADVSLLSLLDPQSAAATRLRSSALPVPFSTIEASVTSCSGFRYDVGSGRFRFV